MNKSCDFLDKWLFPCPGCGKYFSGGGRKTFCEKCIGKIEFFPANAVRCPGCGGIQDNPLALCTQCLAEEPRLWHNALAVMPYAGFGRELIRKYKFGNFPALCRPFGTLAAQLLEESGLAPDILIPIPLHFYRMIQRSYNQSALIARQISKYLEIPVMVDVLKRSRPRATQASLSRHDRHRDLEKVFYLKNPGRLRSRHIMIVDDIFTTGATLSAAAKIIAQAEPKEISVLVIARAVGYKKSLLQVK